MVLLIYKGRQATVDFHEQHPIPPRKLNAMALLAHYINERATLSEIEIFQTIFHQGPSAIRPEFINQHRARFNAFVSPDHVDLKELLITIVKKSFSLYSCCLEQTQTQSSMIMLAFIKKMRQSIALPEAVNGLESKIQSPPSSQPINSIHAPFSRLNSLSKVIYGFLDSNSVCINFGKWDYLEAINYRIILDDPMKSMVTLNAAGFIETVREKGVWGNYFKYDSKKPQGTNCPRSVLSYTKAEERDVFYFIVKSDTQSRSGIGERQLYAKGAIKIIKLFNLLLRIDMSKEKPLFSLRQIATFTKCNGTEKYQNKFSDKSSVLRKFVQHPSSELINWEECLEYQDPTTGEPRILLYQDYLGQPFLSYHEDLTRDQKKRCIASFLHSILRALRRGFLPYDIKLENLCIQQDFQTVHIVDYTGSGLTYSLYKKYPDPSWHPSNIISQTNTGNILDIQSRLSGRKAISDEEYKKLVFDLFFQMVYVIYFICHPDDLYLRRVMLYDACLPMQTASAYFGRSALGRFVVDTIYNQTFQKSLQELVMGFNRNLAGALGSLGIPLSESWSLEFVKRICTFLQTPSPFAPLQIRGLFSLQA